MTINLIFKIAAVGVLVSILCQVLKHSGRDEQAFIVSLAGLILVLSWILPFIYDLFLSIRQLFSLWDVPGAGKEGLYKQRADMAERRRKQGVNLDIIVCRKAAGGRVSVFPTGTMFVYGMGAGMYEYVSDWDHRRGGSAAGCAVQRGKTGIWDLYVRGGQHPSVRVYDRPAGDLCGRGGADERVYQH